MLLKNLRWAMLWALLIFILCAIPGRDIPSISWLEMLSFDKWVHASIFFILVYFSIDGLNKQITEEKKSKLIALLFAVSYGGLLEIMQGVFFQERTADIYDFIANSFGAIMCAIFFAKTHSLVSKILRKG